jgi:hypothetical protein
MNSLAKNALSVLFFLSISSAVAALEPSHIHEALPKKTENYLGEGLVMGGDREVQGGIVKDLRRATNAGFERIVLDLDTEKTPYYQAAVEPNEKRIVVTLFGSPKIGFNAKKVVEQFRKSPLVQKVELFPKVEDDTWIFALHLRAAVPVEIFELSAPSRIIIDLKAAPKFLSEISPAAPAPKATTKKAKAAQYRAVEKPKAHSVERAESLGGNGAAPFNDEIPE